MKQAVIFDLYGVLVLNGWQNFKAKHFTGREHIWHAVYLLGQKVDAGQASFDELVQFTAKQSGESETTVRYQLEHCATNTKLLDYIQSTLQGRYKLGILSNGGSKRVLDRYMPKEQSMFDATVFSREAGIVKPNPEIYRIIAGKLGVAPEDCVFVDDQPPHVAGARTAGMAAVVFKDVARLKQELGELL